jgi:hypothetical protein
VHDLTHDYALFKTWGWMIDTWSPTSGTIDEQTFLDDVKQTVDKDKEILNGLLAREDWDGLVHYFELIDRVQHMMFRYFDPKHPLYTADGAAKWGGSILKSYLITSEDAWAATAHETSLCYTRRVPRRCSRCQSLPGDPCWFCWVCPCCSQVGALGVDTAGAWVIALPMKIAGGSGGPVRLVALVPGKE